jgi:hypothetical protein
MSDFFFLIVVACVVISFVQSFFKHSRSSQRRIYWTCARVAAVAGFFAVYPDWKKGSGFALFALGAMMVMAYVYTPYIKIGGKIYALTVQDSRPDPEDTPAPAAEDPEDDPAPDAYSGIISATKTWWLYIPLLAFIAINTYAFAVGEGEAWVAGTGVAFLVFLAIATGYGDASWGYGIARGQHIQFGVAAVVTAGVFAVLYLVAYQGGKRWPLRRKQSMEFRAHPRHAKDD